MLFNTVIKCCVISALYVRPSSSRSKLPYSYKIGFHQKCTYIMITETTDSNNKYVKFDDINLKTVSATKDRRPGIWLPQYDRLLGSYKNSNI